MKHRKGLSVILTVILALTQGLSSSYAETDPFTDISGHWAEAIIKEAVSLKIVGGYPDGTFLPDNLIKREEFYKLLANILTEKPDTTNTKIQFTDVVDYEWYVPTIKIAVASGTTSGYGDGTFGIGLMISRQEAAKVAGSVIPTTGSEGENGAEIALDKGRIADWAYDYVDLMFKKGYMKGDTEGNFRPTTALTRAEAATILLNVKKNEPIIAANADKLSATSCMAAHLGQEGVFLKGEGTKSDPYEIANEEQLNHMKMHTSEGTFYILKKNIAITKDYAVIPPSLAVGGVDWTSGNVEPLGSKESPFKGSLIGNGYTISGLNISGSIGKNSDKTGASYAGLFGYLASGSTVADVIIDASTITGNQYTGAVVGYNEGMVRNCTLGKKGIVNGRSYTGGIAGYNEGTISFCYNSGAVKADLNGGGIIGDNGSKVDNCYNVGMISGTSYIGGIAGRNSGTITNVYSAGGVTGDTGVGSLVGRNAANLSNAFWLEGTENTAIGLSDGSGGQQLVEKLTHEELSGQAKIKTIDGYLLVVDIMNANNKTSADVINKTEPAAVWKYLYSIIPPIGNQSTDQTGNSIDPNDINTKYLYPIIIH